MSSVRGRAKSRILAIIYRPSVCNIVTELRRRVKRLAQALRALGHSRQRLSRFLVVEHGHHLESPSGKWATACRDSLSWLQDRGLPWLPEPHHVELPAVVTSLPADEAVRVMADRVEVHDSGDRVEESNGIPDRGGRKRRPLTLTEDPV